MEEGKVPGYLAPTEATYGRSRRGGMRKMDQEIAFIRHQQAERIREIEEHTQRVAERVDELEANYDAAENVTLYWQTHPTESKENVQQLIMNFNNSRLEKGEIMESLLRWLDIASAPDHPANVLHGVANTEAELASQLQDVQDSLDTGEMLRDSLVGAKQKVANIVKTTQKAYEGVFSQVTRKFKDVLSGSDLMFLKDKLEQSSNSIETLTAQMEETTKDLTQAGEHIKTLEETLASTNSKLTAALNREKVALAQIDMLKPDLETMRMRATIAETHLQEERLKNEDIQSRFNNLKAELDKHIGDERERMEREKPKETADVDTITRSSDVPPGHVFKDNHIFETDGVKSASKFIDMHKALKNRVAALQKTVRGTVNKDALGHMKTVPVQTDLSGPVQAPSGGPNSQESSSNRSDSFGLKDARSRMNTAPTAPTIDQSTETDATNMESVGLQVRWESIFNVTPSASSSALALYASASETDLEESLPLELEPLAPPPADEVLSDTMKDYFDQERERVLAAAQAQYNKQLSRLIQQKYETQQIADQTRERLSGRIDELTTQLQDALSGSNVVAGGAPQPPALPASTITMTSSVDGHETGATRGGNSEPERDLYSEDTRKGKGSLDAEIGVQVPEDESTVAESTAGGLPKPKKGHRVSHDLVLPSVHPSGSGASLASPPEDTPHLPGSGDVGKERDRLSPAKKVLFPRSKSVTFILPPHSSPPVEHPVASAPASPTGGRHKTELLDGARASGAPSALPTQEVQNKLDQYKVQLAQKSKQVTDLKAILARYKKALAQFKRRGNQDSPDDTLGSTGARDSARPHPLNTNARSPSRAELSPVLHIESDTGSSPSHQGISKQKVGRSSPGFAHPAAEGDGEEGTAIGHSNAMPSRQESLASLASKSQASLLSDIGDLLSSPSAQRQARQNRWSAHGYQRRSPLALPPDTRGDDNDSKKDLGDTDIEVAQDPGNVPRQPDSQVQPAAQSGPASPSTQGTSLWDDYGSDQQYEDIRDDIFGSSQSDLDDVFGRRRVSISSDSGSHTFLPIEGQDSLTRSDISLTRSPGSTVMEPRSQGSHLIRHKDDTATTKKTKQAQSGNRGVTKGRKGPGKSKGKNKGPDKKSDTSDTVEPATGQGRSQKQASAILRVQNGSRDPQDLLHAQAEAIRVLKQKLSNEKVMLARVRREAEEEKAKCAQHSREEALAAAESAARASVQSKIQAQIAKVQQHYESQYSAHIAELNDEVRQTRSEIAEVRGYAAALQEGGRDIANVYNARLQYFLDRVLNLIEDQRSASSDLRVASLHGKTMASKEMGHALTEQQKRSIARFTGALDVINHGTSRMVTFIRELDGVNSHLIRATTTAIQDVSREVEAKAKEASLAQERAKAAQKKVSQLELKIARKQQPRGSTVVRALSSPAHAQPSTRVRSPPKKGSPARFASTPGSVGLPLPKTPVPLSPSELSSSVPNLPALPPARVISQPRKPNPSDKEAVGTAGPYHHVTEQARTGDTGDLGRRSPVRAPHHDDSPGKSGAGVAGRRMQPISSTAHQNVDTSYMLAGTGDSAEQRTIATRTESAVLSRDRDRGGNAFSPSSIKTSKAEGKDGNVSQSPEQVSSGQLSSSRPPRGDSRLKPLPATDHALQPESVERMATAILTRTSQEALPGAIDSSRRDVLPGWDPSVEAWD